MPQRVLRGAIIGFGNVAANGHMPGWQARDDVAIVAAVDAAPERRAAFLAACPAARGYGNAAGLMSGEKLDFVDICTPPGSHGTLIERALDAGLHVLCEKPLVTRLADARIVAAAAARSGRIVHAVHNWLEAPVCRRISMLIDEGAIGRVRSIQWRTLRTQPSAAAGPDGGGNWRVDPAIAGGGILLDHGWHALYCVLRWAGAAPNAVAALLETRRFHDWPLEDTATVALDLPEGTGHIFLTWAAEERSNRIAIEGARGRIVAVGDSVVAETPAGERRWSGLPSLSEGSHHPDWFGGVAADFHAAVTGSGTGNLDEALLCARLIDLAQRSSAGGGARLSVVD